MRYFIGLLLVALSVAYMLPGGFGGIQRVKIGGSGQPEPSFDADSLVGKKLVSESELSSMTFDHVKHFKKESLPHSHRVFTPTHNIGTMDHRPERLNVVVDEHNVVQRTYWG
eukprot:ANDGO_00920.mRNA.1 hypothetical protein